jgi:hypothetical protein
VTALITSLSDDQFGTLTGDADCAVGTELAVGASCTFDATFSVPAGDYPGSHVNVFAAHAKDAEENDAWDDESESIAYTDVLPDVSVAKDASPTEVPETGGWVTFTVVVSNLNSEPVTLNSLTTRCSTT